MLFMAVCCLVVSNGIGVTVVAMGVVVRIVLCEIVVTFDACCERLD